MAFSFFLQQICTVWISSIASKVIFITSSLLKLLQIIDHRERQVIPKALCIKILCLALRFKCVSCHKNSQEDSNIDWPPTICNKNSGSLVIFYAYINKFSLSQFCTNKMIWIIHFCVFVVPILVTFLILTKQVSLF